MFFYRDAQHQVDIHLHPVPVNRPFMLQLFSSLDFGGRLCVDANIAGNKQYAPNSFAHKFRIDSAEPAFVVFDNICRLKGYYWHESMKNNYDQSRGL
ncbi:hypothetical protein F4801DRAFT_558954 [Xylaria longipes]|nr:hypothetical protein F4801DRAFT_558954 [Xylaria longipes]